MRRATIAIDLLLPRHRNAQGVLRVDQVIHTLGIFGNRERYALDLAVEGVTRGAGPTISNSLLRTFFRRGEHGFVFPDLLGDQRIEFLVHGRQQFFVVLGMGRIGQVVHFLGIQQQVVEGDVVVGQQLLDRCRQVVVTHPEVADQLVTAVEDAAEQLALFKVRHANLVDEAFERLHAAMKLLAGLVAAASNTLVALRLNHSASMVAIIS